MVKEGYRVPLDRSVLDALIERFYGGVELLADLWNDEFPETARDKKTLYNWLSHGVPMTPSGYSFFCFLDLDPMSLVDHTKLDISKNYSKIRSSLLRSGQAYRGLNSLFEPFSPHLKWPNDHLLWQRNGRIWERHFFEHDATAEINQMARITLVPTGDDFQASYPRAWYIAYLPGSRLDDFWWPYGILIRRNNTNFLVTSRGHIFEDHSFANESRLVFGTEFGAGAAKFCVASAHPFDCRVEFPSTRVCALRFLP